MADVSIRLPDGATVDLAAREHARIAEYVSEGATVANLVYLRSPAGMVLDMDPAKGGKPEQYIEAGWRTLTKAEFEVALRAQIARQAEERAAWIRDMEEDGDIDPKFTRAGNKMDKGMRDLRVGAS